MKAHSDGSNRLEMPPREKSESKETTRSRAMARRKALILFHAREMIADEGFDSLKLRDLATRAKLTVPTIYNLIGGKPEILSLIIEDLVTRLKDVQRSSGDAEEPFVAMVEKLAELFATDESYYRAAFIAGDRGGLFEQTSKDGIFAQSVALPIEACQAAAAVGLLKGDISATQLGEQIYGCYRLARQDWTLGYIGLEDFTQRALTGIYLCLAADATEKYHTQLTHRINELNENALPTARKK